MKPPPPLLDYQTREPSPRIPPSWWYFSAGLFGGIGISLAYYIWLFNREASLESDLFAYGAITFKVVAAIVLLYFPRFKSLGLGLITSIPIGILIFVGVCFSTFRL